MRNDRPLLSILLHHEVLRGKPRHHAVRFVGHDEVDKDQIRGGRESLDFGRTRLLLPARGEGEERHNRSRSPANHVARLRATRRLQQADAQGDP
jgi:hypothetical protein